MSIKILETKEGFKFEGKKYLWGEGLIELANCDFSKLKEMQLAEVSDEEKTYGDYLLKFLNLDTKSIHYELLRRTLDNYIKNINEIIDNANYLEQKIQDKEVLHSDIWNFISPLFVCKNKIYNILLHLDRANKEFNSLPTAEKLFPLYKSNKSILNVLEEIPTENGTLTIYEPFNSDLDFSSNVLKLEFNRFEPNSGTRITFNEGNIEYIHEFSSVEDFVFYELLKVLDKEPKIIKCKYCEKFCIVKDIRSLYCSLSCKNKGTQENIKQNPYKEEYMKKYKYLYNKYYGPNRKSQPKDKQFERLKKLYKDYIQPDSEEIDNNRLNEFIRKIKEIT